MRKSEIYDSGSKSWDWNNVGFSHCGGFGSVGSPNRSAAERGGAWEECGERGGAD